MGEDTQHTSGSTARVNPRPRPRLHPHPYPRPALYSSNTTRYLHTNKNKSNREILMFKQNTTRSIDKNRTLDTVDMSSVYVGSFDSGLWSLVSGFWALSSGIVALNYSTSALLQLRLGLQVGSVITSSK